MICPFSVLAGTRERNRRLGSFMIYEMADRQAGVERETEAAIIVGDTHIIS